MATKIKKYYEDENILITDEDFLPDELSDLSDDATHRLVTDVEKSYWNAKEDVSNKSNSISTDASSTTKYPSVKAFKDYVDLLVAWLLDYRWTYNASSNTFPATWWSWTAWAIMKWDAWIISVTWTLWWISVAVWDWVIAKVDAPAQTVGNWSFLNVGLWYVPENVTNKVTSISWSSTDTQYASAKLLYDQLWLKLNLSQTTWQTIWDTTNRLTKLWATDITVTNAITWSVTWNAGTVTTANEITDTTCYLWFFTWLTWSQAVKTNNFLIYNSNTWVLWAQWFVAKNWTLKLWSVWMVWWQITFYNNNDTWTNIISVENISTNNYTNVIPAKSWTFAMTSDLSSYVPTSTTVNTLALSWNIVVKPSNIPMETLVGTPTYWTVNDFLNSFGSTWRKTWWVATNAGSSKVAITWWTWFIKATDDDNAQLLPFNWSAPADITIPANSSRYIWVKYNAGTPQIVTKTSSTWDYDTEFPLARAVNETINGAEELYVANTPWWVTDWMTNVIQAIRSFWLVRRDDYKGWLMLSWTWTRNIAVSEWTVWVALNDTNFAWIDTAVTWTVEWYWYKAWSGWQKSDLTQWSKTQYNDISQTTLQNLSANKYANVWVYWEITGSTISIALLYPQAQYNTAAEAEAKSAPDNVPTHIAQLWMLLWRYIIKQNVDAPVSTQSVFTTKFSTSVVTSHANLGSLGWTSSWHTGTASTIAGFAASTWIAAEYTLSWTWTVLATTNWPTFVAPVLWAATGTTWLFGATANLTDWATARIVGSQADSWHSYSWNIWVVWESVASASDTWTWVWWVSVTNWANEARWVTWVWRVGATGDTAKANWVYWYVNWTHAWWDNIWVRWSAINWANNYSFYWENWKIYSSWDIELGHLTDTTIHREAAWLYSVGWEIMNGFTSTATAAWTTTMDKTYTKIQQFTGTTTQTVKLPTTWIVKWQQYIIQNIGTTWTSVVTVQSSWANTILILGWGCTWIFTSTQATPTTAAHWTFQKIGKNVVTATSYTTDTWTSLNCDYWDTFIITAQAWDLKLNNPTGTARIWQLLKVSITWTAARALTYDTQFLASTVTLPPTTVTTAQLNMIFEWNGTSWVILWAV